jgi:hypothetical protein
MAINERQRNKVGLAEYVGKKLGVGALGIGGAVAQLGSTVAGELGAEDIEYALGSKAYNAELVAKRWDEEVGGTQTIHAGDDSITAKASRGELEAIDVGRAFTDLALTQAPQFLAGGFAAKGGAMLLGPVLKKALPEAASQMVGAAAGTGAFMSAQETGSILQDQDDSEQDLLKASAMGVPAGLLESGSMLLGMSRMGIGKYVAGELADKGVRTAGQLTMDVGKQIFSEASTEAIQTVLEQSGARKGWDIIDDLKNTNMEEVIEAAAAGGVMGGAMTGISAPITNKLKKIDEARKAGIKEARDEHAAESEAIAEDAKPDVAKGDSASLLDGATSVDEQAAVHTAAKRQEALNRETKEKLTAGNQDAAAQAAEEAADSATVHTKVSEAADKLEVKASILDEWILTVGSSFKTAKEFVANMVQTFGEAAKKVALKLWSHVNNERGNIELRKADIKRRMDEAGLTPEDVKGMTFVEIEEAIAAVGIMPQEEGRQLTKDEQDQAELDSLIAAADGQGLTQEELNERELQELMAGAIDEDEVGAPEKTPVEKRLDALDAEWADSKTITLSKAEIDMLPPELTAYAESGQPTEEQYNAIHDYIGVEQPSMVEQEELNVQYGAAENKRLKALFYARSSAAIKKKYTSAEIEDLADVYLAGGYDAVHELIGKADADTLVEHFSTIQELEAKAIEEEIDIEEGQDSEDESYVSDRGAAASRKNRQESIPPDMAEALKAQQGKFPFIKTVAGEIVERTKTRPESRPKVIASIEQANKKALASLRGSIASNKKLREPLGDGTGRTIGDYLYDEVVESSKGFIVSDLIRHIELEDGKFSKMKNLPASLHEFDQGKEEGVDDAGDQDYRKISGEDLAAAYTTRFPKEAENANIALQVVSEHTDAVAKIIAPQIDAGVNVQSPEVIDNVVVAIRDVAKRNRYGIPSNVPTSLAKMLAEGIASGVLNVETTPRTEVLSEEAAGTGIYQRESIYTSPEQEKLQAKVEAQAKERFILRKKMREFPGKSPDKLTGELVTGMLDQMKKTVPANKIAIENFSALLTALRLPKLSAPVKSKAPKLTAAKIILHAERGGKSMFTDEFNALPPAEQQTLIHRMMRSLYTLKKPFDKEAFAYTLLSQSMDLIPPDPDNTSIYESGLYGKGHPATIKDRTVLEPITTLREGDKSLSFDFGDDLELLINYAKTPEILERLMKDKWFLRDLFQTPKNDPDPVITGKALAERLDRYADAAFGPESQVAFDLQSELKSYLTKAAKEQGIDLRTSQGQMGSADVSTIKAAIARKKNALAAAVNILKIEGRDRDRIRKINELLKKNEAAKYDKARAVVAGVMSKLRVELAKDIFTHRNMLEDDAFSALTEDHYYRNMRTTKVVNGRKISAKMTEEDFFAIYIEVGQNFSRFQARLDFLVHNANMAVQEAAIKKAYGKGESVDIRAYVTETFTEQQKKDYEGFETNVTSRQPKKIAAFNAKINSLSTRDLKLFRATKDFEKSLEFYGKKLDSQERSAATIKSSNGVAPIVSDIFRQKSESSMSEFEKGLVGITVGKLRNRLVNTFYQKVAEGFGADLVIVSDPEYRSRYIPEAADGRPKIIINAAGDLSFHHVFSHEVFHHVLNRVPESQQKTFKDAIKKTLQDGTDVTGKPDTYRTGMAHWNEMVDEIMFKENLSRPAAEEEVLAEIFANVSSQKGFYQHLSSTFLGKEAGAATVLKIVQNIETINKKAMPLSSSHIYESYSLISSAKMKDIYKLVTDIIGGDEMVNTMSLPADGQTSQFEKNKNLNSNDVKMFTQVLGWRSVNEIKGYLSKPTSWIKGLWSKLFAPGTKNHRQLMTNIEGILKDTLEWLKNHIPQGAFADFLADPKSTQLASKIAHLGELKASDAYHKHVKKHVNTFKGMGTDKLESIHDDFVRGRVIKDPVLRKSLIRKGQGALDAAEAPIDVMTEAGVAMAKRRGYSDDIIDAFKGYRKVADEIYEQLKLTHPEIKYEPTHYGQAIKWKKTNGVLLDDSFSAAIYGEDSKLGNTKAYTKDKVKTPTREIVRGGKIKYHTIEPNAMFLDYVREAYKVIGVGQMVDGAIKSKRAKMFKTPEEALEAGYHFIDDPMFMNKRMVSESEFKVKIGNTFLQATDGGVAFASREEAEAAASAMEDAEYEIVESIGEAKEEDIAFDLYGVDENGIRTLIRTAPTQATADSLLAHYEKTYPNNKYEVDTTTGMQLYFHKDLAKMTRTITARDNLRNGSLLGISGHTAMNVKNHMTSVEFAFSMFHAFTISQELLAANSSWAWQRHKGKGIGKKASGYNPLAGFGDAKRISALLTMVRESEDLATDTAVLEEANRLLGTTNVDLLDMVENFYLVGGMMKGQDQGLRSSVHDLGEARYSKEPYVAKMVNGKVEYTQNRPLSQIHVGIKEGVETMMESVKEVHREAIANEPDKNIKAIFNSVRFAGLEVTTAWLMEEAIPKIKMSIWMKEYTLQLDKFKGEIAAGTKTKHQIAHDTMKFVEDRFGEVNWKNQWMIPSYKTALQFLFRSFTWFTGSWKALSKAGVDMGKLGWFKVKDIGAAEGDKVNYELTSKGMWGINAVVAHLMVSGALTALYQIGTAIEGEEVPDDEDTPLMTKLLFPRVDPQDPFNRVSVPSYVTEAYKIMHHIGMIGTHAEPHKLISGRFNSIVGNMAEVAAGRDFRGVEIVNDEDTMAGKAFDVMWHVFGAAPISFSSAIQGAERKGFDAGDTALSLLGMTSAPAVAKRSAATNRAFEIRREEYKGKTVSEEVMELKDETKRAAYAYGNGDKKPLNELRSKGKISKRQYDIAITRIPRINGKVNPKYESPLSVAMRGLTMASALEVWELMSDNEKSEQRALVKKKYRNMVGRKDKSPIEKTKIRKQMKELKLL